MLRNQQEFAIISVWPQRYLASKVVTTVANGKAAKTQGGLASGGANYAAKIWVGLHWVNCFLIFFVAAKPRSNNFVKNQIDVKEIVVDIRKNCLCEVAAATDFIQQTTCIPYTAL